VARLAPMFGLMGTLIPLGPGIIALSQGDTQTLADSLLIAFDTTVAGLAAAGVAFAISRLRKRWYEDYLDTLAALMEACWRCLTMDGGLRNRQRRTLRATEDVNPLEGVVNIADVMLVFACGLMLALAVYWNIELGPWESALT